MWAMDARDQLRDIGEQKDPVAEALRRMLHEFCEEHYHTCPAYEDDAAECDCFAGALIKSSLETFLESVAQKAQS